MGKITQRFDFPVLNEKNLLNATVVVVDDRSVADLVRTIVSGMAIDARNNTATQTPAKNKQRQ